MSRVTALLVTHNAERWIGDLAESVLGQSRTPDRIVVLDDHSTDSTISMLRDILRERVTIIESSATTDDAKTRIAQNFQQGLRACVGADVVVIGDHDDIWHPQRVARQEQLLLSEPTALMVASDGRLVDDEGRPTGGTLRSVFPVPLSWETDSAPMRMRAVLRSSLATGGASAVRPELLAALTIPQGWLHDRWWSLIAAAREGMVVDRDVVIDYRVTSEQHVGLDRASQHWSRTARVAEGLSRRHLMTQRWKDLRQELAPLGTTRTAPELRGTRLLRSLV